MVTRREIRKFRKKKEKEKEKRKKILARRQRLRQEAKEDREQRRRERKLEKLHRQLEMYGQYVEKSTLFDADDSVISALNKNIEILKNLEDEYYAELESRKQLNKELEEQGHHSFQEKIAAVMQKVDIQQIENTQGEQNQENDSSS